MGFMGWMGRTSVSAFSYHTPSKRRSSSSSQASYFPGLALHSPRGESDSGDLSHS